MLTPEIAIAPQIHHALTAGAWVVFSLSGGKDSSAATAATMDALDQLGHPRTKRAAIHADLGRIEWASTREAIERLCTRFGLPLTIVRRRSGGLIERWQQRFENVKRRYASLETLNLIGPWSSASLRFCTSEQKSQVICAELMRRYRGEHVISVIGIRREQSPRRAHTPIAHSDIRLAKPGNRHGTHMTNWHPIAKWSEAAVYRAHALSAMPLHEAYERYGATRLGCQYCVLASEHNLKVSTSAPENIDVFRELVDLELISTFSFQPARWLADMAPHHLNPRARNLLPSAKHAALERRQLEASMPRELRFTRGWPPRVPTRVEATRIIGVRAQLLRRHALDNHYPNETAVIERFAELIAKRNAGI